MKKGELWLVNIPESDGHEQQGSRPVMVVVELEANITLIIPCTSNQKALRFPNTFEIIPNKTNKLENISIALLFQLRAIDKKRLIKKPFSH